MFHPFGIFPEAFELVKLALVGRKDVYHYIDVINESPLIAVLTVVRVFITLLFYFVFYMIGDRFDLCIRLGFTQNEKVGDRFLNIPQVERYHRFAFFVLDGGDDGLEKLAVPVQAGGRLFSSLQCGYYFLQKLNFCLVGNIFILSKIRILLAPIPAETLKIPVLALDTIDSTNNYAMGLIDADKAQHGLTITARQQTAGKGQRGRQWAADAGKSLLMSLILVPECRLDRQFAFNAAVAIAIASALEPLCQHWSVQIKWPNDIIVNDKKAGGILIENVLRGSHWHYAVVGLGLNVQQDAFPPELPNATSLRLAAGLSFSVEELLPLIRESVLKAVQAAQLPAALEAYNHRLFRKEHMQQFSDGQKEWHARVEKVLPDGRLEVLHEDGHREAYVHGAVNWVW